MKSHNPTSTNRSWRRGAKPQQQSFFAKEGTTDAGQAFFQPRSPDPAAKAPEEKPMAKAPEEEVPVAKAPEEEPLAKGPEEEMPAKVPEEKPLAKGPEEEPQRKAPDEEMAAAKCGCGGGGCSGCSEQAKEAAGPANAAPVASRAPQGGESNAISSAMSHARSLAEGGAAVAREATAQPGGESAGTERAKEARSHFRRWFGAAEPGLARRVAATLRRAASFLTGGRLHFAGDDQSRVFAKVQRRSGLVTLGRRFWKQSTAKGRDSQAGILLHEAAHAADPAVADHAYQASAERLAQRDPEHAAANADSIEYFAESSRNR